MNKIAMVALVLAASAAGLAGCSQEPAPGAAVQGEGATVAQLKAIFPTLQGRHTDPASGEIVLDILAEDAADRAVNDNKKAAEKLLGAPVRLSVLPAPLRPQAVP